jgi:hypothetical protein
MVEKLKELKDKKRRDGWSYDGSIVSAREGNADEFF